MGAKLNSGESKVEAVKLESRRLRGTIAETLATDATHFVKEDTEVLKFHGVYQNDDRDTRHRRRKAGLEKAYQFMIRCSIPAGVLTAEQYLNMDAIADKYANGSLRITTRQGLQLHGVICGNLKATIAGINAELMTTLSACGDVERNVMACPAPLADAAHQAVSRTAHEIGTQLRPASNAYHELWLDGTKQISTAQEEPFYGDQYLPRKFKTAIGLVDDNCVDVYSHDVGLIAFVEDGRVTGYDVVVGGGLGMTHGKQDTMACLAKPLGFIAPDCAVSAAKIVAAIFRDFGNRGDRRHARLKYLIAERGMDWFHAEFRRRANFELHDWRPTPEPVWHDHLGRHRQGEGVWFYGVFVENGRVKDNGADRAKTALRRIVESFRPGVTLTPHQSLLLTGLSEDDVDAVEQMLIEHGVTPPTELTAARRYSMACPALPTCGLAVADAERIMPSIVDRFEEELDSLGLRDEPITLRMTGCPNGCVRPYTADIAFVGRGALLYNVYVGGGLPGNRIADLYAADVKVDDLVETLRPLLSSWAEHRRPDESLGDYYQRVLDRSQPRQAITGREEPTHQLIELKVRS